MRRETSPEALSQLVESVHDVFDSTLPSVLNRTARERREPGAENHARVEQIGVGDDAFGKARARFVDERQHESVLEVPIRARKTAGLLRAAADVFIETLAAFHAEIARLDFRIEPFRDLPAECRAAALAGY